MPKSLENIFESITSADAQGMHYVLAAIATSVVILRYAFARQFDIPYATFCITFWGTAIGNEKLNAKVGNGNGTP